MLREVVVQEHSPSMILRSWWVIGSRVSWRTPGSRYIAIVLWIGLVSAPRIWSGTTLSVGSDVGPQLRVNSAELLVVGLQQRVISDELLVIGLQLQVIAVELLVVGLQLQVIVVELLVVLPDLAQTLSQFTLLRFLRAHLLLKLLHLPSTSSQLCHSIAQLLIVVTQLLVVVTQVLVLKAEGLHLVLKLRIVVYQAQYCLFTIIKFSGHIAELIKCQLRDGKRKVWRLAEYFFDSLDLFCTTLS
jgi:hypothetical protein